MIWPGSRAPAMTKTRPPSASGPVHQLVDGAAQGGESDAPGHDDHVAGARSTASSTPQGVPKGPRTPTTSPGPARHRARVTGPTSRTVCRRGPSSRLELLTEMAASPTP